jgi:tetratricopeptide (TPR) repeat protein
MFLITREAAINEKGKYDKSIANLTEAIQLKADDAAFFYNRGSSYRDKGEYSKASRDYLAAMGLLELQIMDNAAFYDLGNSYAEKGEKYKAFAGFVGCLSDIMDKLQIT